MVNGSPVVLGTVLAVDVMDVGVVDSSQPPALRPGRPHRCSSASTSPPGPSSGASRARATPLLRRLAALGPGWSPQRGRPTRRSPTAWSMPSGPTVGPVGSPTVSLVSEPVPAWFWRPRWRARASRSTPRRGRSGGASSGHRRSRASPTIRCSWSTPSAAPTDPKLTREASGASTAAQVHPVVGRHARDRRRCPAVPSQGRSVAHLRSSGFGGWGWSRPPRRGGGVVWVVRSG